MFDVLYDGNSPPNTLTGLSVIEQGVSEATLASRYATGRAANNNYSLIVRSNGATVYYVPKTVGPVPEFKTLTGDKFMALIVGVLGIDRTDQLIAKSKTIEALLLRASFVNRTSGNLPTALNKLMQGANALTQAELDQIDAAWRAV